MSVIISPLDLLLDDENPRFVVLNSREQADIRKYLVTYEDVCDLAVGINNYGEILPGERVVALKREDKYVVVEGNRRTCSLQLLLNPTLIPDGFHHRIPKATDKLRTSSQTIEVDLVPTREAALELMTKRHIEGVKQWKPLAKKQFSASNYAAGQSVSNLSRITGMREGDIKADIRDYKLFLSAYDGYCSNHPDYSEQIVNLKIEPFLRVFKAKFKYKGVDVKPIDVLKISYTDNHDTISDLPADVFNHIIQTIFEEATITEKINTRNTLKDVTGVISVLDSVAKAEVVGNPAPVNQTLAGLTPDNPIPVNPTPGNPTPGGPTPGNPTPGGSTPGNPTPGGSTPGNSEPGNPIPGGPIPGNPTPGGSTPGNSEPGNPIPGGPIPGGPAPRTFFETLSWDRKLSPSNPEHEGLLSAVHELYILSITSCGRKKAYEVFPVATGMILRTAYEQVLQLRLKQTNLWGSFMQTVRRNSFPTLSGMESFIGIQNNKVIVLPSTELQSAIGSITTYGHREFLNANIHNPGAIRVSADSLSGIAQGGMFTLIQESINLL